MMNEEISIISPLEVFYNFINKYNKQVVVIQKLFNFFKKSCLFIGLSFIISITPDFFNSSTRSSHFDKTLQKVFKDAKEKGAIIESKHPNNAHTIPIILGALCIAFLAYLLNCIIKDLRKLDKMISKKRYINQTS